MRRQLLLAAIGILGAGSAAAQQSSADDVGTELRRSFDQVSSWVTAAADLVPAERYGYRPAETVRTFGQLVGHLADAYNWYCAQAAGQNVAWADPVEKSGGDKSALVQQLKQALDRCNALYAGTGGIRPMIENVGHTSIHYGNMVTYIRLLGLTPPSS
jgi:uncharacterized damage-inducible protein DinB